MNETTDDADDAHDENLHRCRCRECECKNLVLGSDVLCRKCRDGDHDNQPVEGEI